MCTAQVLLVNRDVMRRNFGGDVNRRVCRKLFDSNEPNAVSPNVFLRKMHEEIRKKDTERWNFDFMTETPLPGRYQWEPVFATTTTTSNSHKKVVSTTESNREIAPTAEPVVEEIRREAPSPTSTLKKKRKTTDLSSQQKITEFLTKKKKYNADELSSPKLKVRRVNRNTESLATTTRLR